MSKAIDKAAGVEREVFGHHPLHRAGGHLQNGGENTRPRQAAALEAGHGGDITAPATAEAARWQGWGTALKPGWEIIVVARKPLIGTVAANILQYGTGALNIDATRIDGGERPHIQNAGRNDPAACYGSGKSGSVNLGSTSLGRWPANVVLDEDAAAELDQQSGKLTSGRVQPGGFSGPYRGEVYGAYARNEIREETVYGDTGGASRFFYTAKASKRERPVVDGVAHPTVKPLSLMRWLVRLVTPPGGIVLDPFAGSGPTIEAALLEGFHAIGVEREAPYLPLIKARLSRIAQLPLDFTTGEG